MKKQVALFSLCTLTLATLPSYARETILSGGVDLGIEFNDQTSTAEEPAQDEQVTPVGEASSQEAATVVDLPDDDDDFSRIVVSPSIKIATSTARTEFEVEYHPQLNYDDDGDNSIDQALSSSANWAVSRAWQVNIADDYAETDDPGSTETLFAAEDGGAAGDEAAAESSRETESQLSDVSGRHQVTTNTATIETSYSYWEDSSANLGYGYEILRNDEDDTVYQDFDRHDIFAGVVHRLNSNYRLSLKGDYVIGEIEEQVADQAALPADQSDLVVAADDQQNTVDSAADDPVDVNESEDLVEYHLATVLDILTLPKHPLSVEYDLALIDYDAESKGDIEIHTAMLGWGWEVNDKLSLSLGAGPTYQRRDGGEDSWDYAVRFDIDYQLEKSRFQLSGGSGTEVRNFTGTDDNALTNYWEARAVYSRDLLDTLDMFIFAAYNHDDREALELTSDSAATDTASVDSDSADGSTLNLSTSTVTEKIALGGGLTYSFWQWYSAKLSYTFTTQEGDEAEDQYDEHRVMMQLSMHKDFLKW